MKQTEPESIFQYVTLSTKWTQTHLTSTCTKQLNHKALVLSCSMYTYVLCTGAGEHKTPRDSLGEKVCVFISVWWGKGVVRTWRSALLMSRRCVAFSRARWVVSLLPWKFQSWQGIAEGPISSLSATIWGHVLCARNTCCIRGTGCRTAATVHNFDWDIIFNEFFMHALYYVQYSNCCVAILFWFVHITLEEWPEIDCTGGWRLNKPVAWIHNLKCKHSLEQN